MTLPHAMHAQYRYSYRTSNSQHLAEDNDSIDEVMATEYHGEGELPRVHPPRDAPIQSPSPDRRRRRGRRLPQSPRASLPRARSPRQSRPACGQFRALPRVTHAIQRRKKLSRATGMDSTVDKDCLLSTTGTPCTDTGRASVSSVDVSSIFPLHERARHG